MKYAFLVRNQPDLYRVLQETAHSIGKHWGNTPLIDPWLIRQDNPDYLLVDTEEGFLSADWRNIFEGGEPIEAYDSRMRRQLQADGYKLDALDEFFALKRKATEASNAEQITISDDSAEVCGILTHVSNIELWRLCHDKLRSLGFNRTNNRSVPSDGILIDSNKLECWDCWIDREFPHREGITYDGAKWINVADLLSWERLLTEADALNEYAKMWRTGNYEHFIDLLSIDFKYQSQSVSKELQSKYAFAHYIREEFQLMEKDEFSIVGDIGMLGEKPCMVLTKKHQQSRQKMIAFASVCGGMITTISVGQNVWHDKVRFQCP